MRVISVGKPLRIILTTVVVTAVLVGFASARTVTREADIVDAGSRPDPLPVSGTQSVSGDLRSRLVLRPDPEALSSGEDTLAAPAQDEVLFWAWDFYKQQYHQVRAVNAYRSASVWIYVERGRQVPSSAVQDLGRLFDDTIYPTLRTAYGRDPYPGIDNQAAISVLMLDIRDPLFYGVDPPTYFSGYFDPTNQLHQKDVSGENPHARSNEREMVYLDISPGDPLGARIRQTLAHEFAHLIHWSYDPDEVEWLSEGLSELAVFLCGLGHPRGHVQAFLDDPAGTLVAWSGEPADYGRVYLFMLYLHERTEGSSTTWLRRLVRNPDNGIRSVGTSFPADDNIELLFRDFVLALFLDRDAAEGGIHGFRSLDLSADGQTGGFRYPPAVVHPPGSFQLLVELEPWAMRADLIEVLQGSAEIELRALQDSCAGAGWRDVGDAEHTRTVCLAAGRTAIWPFVNPDAGSRALLLTVANPSAHRLVLELSSIESVKAQSRATAAFLPLSVRQ